MLKFLAGVLAGVLSSVAYVYFNVQLPPFLALPGHLKGDVVSAVADDTLYNLDADAMQQLRALETYFDNRAHDAAQLDADAGHPLLKALHRNRAIREARQVSMQWTAFDNVLAQPALRVALERRHGTTDVETLKRAMLLTAVEGKPFLKRWIETTSGPVLAENIREVLKEIGASQS